MKSTLVSLVVLASVIGDTANAQCCADCNGNGTVAVNELVTAVNHLLRDCSDDGICSAATCPSQLAQCRDELTDCRANSGDATLLASGQTTSYGPGSDGAVRAGAVVSYTDNGDGTITDNNTGLMWEKKDDSGGIHDKDNTYTWGMTSPPHTMNGTMVTEFLATLNTPPCYADHCDWRIPNVRELPSIAYYANVSPAVTAAFHNAASCTGCTDVRMENCTCALSNFYWSSTTYGAVADEAWAADFSVGSLFAGSKSAGYAVRAVRGGS